MKKENLSSLARISKFGGWVYRFELILITLLLVGGFIAFFFVSIEENDVFEGFIILGYCILAAISLYFSYLIAGYFFLAANDKGYYDVFYLALCFFLPPVGYLLVIALPDRGNNEEQEEI